MPPKVLRRVVKPLVWLLCLTPAALLAYDAYAGGLGVNPIEEVTHRTGRWALILLLVTLAVTPVRRLTGWHQAVQLRRTLGLFAFAYAVLHFLHLHCPRPVLRVRVHRRGHRRTAVHHRRLRRVPAAHPARRDIDHPRDPPARPQLGPSTASSTSPRPSRLLHFLWLVKAPAIGRPLRYGAVLVLLLASGSCSRCAGPRWHGPSTGRRTGRPWAAAAPKAVVLAAPATCAEEGERGGQSARCMWQVERPVEGQVTFQWRSATAWWPGPEVDSRPTHAICARPNGASRGRAIVDTSPAAAASRNEHGRDPGAHGE